MAKAKTISLSVWKRLFRDVLVAFSKVWWRIASINIITILVLIIGTIILVGGGYLIFGGMIENLIANISFGGSLLSFLPLIGFVILWAIFVTVSSVNGKIANTLVLKNYIQKKKRSPFKIYFIDAWHYLWRQIIISLQVIWYVLWPVLLTLGIGIIFMAVTKMTLSEEIALSVLNFAVYGILLVIIIALSIWRLIHVIFMKSTLVHFDKDTKSTFKAMVKLVKGNWWGVFLSIVGFVGMINIVRILFIIPENIFFTKQDFNIFAVLDFFFSFFIFVPLIISFMYLFMLHLSKTKKVKP